MDGFNKRFVFCKSLYATLEPRVSIPFLMSVIWNSKATSKTNFFTWEANWGKVLTLDQL